MPIREDLRRSSLLAAAAFLTALASPGWAATYKVGVGAGCTHPDLFSALVAAVGNPGSDDIRLLAGSTHQGPFFVNTDGLSITGGYASCSATTATGASTLLGTNSSRALFLSATGTVTLNRLSITGGTVSGDGGGLFVQGAGTVVLYEVLVFGNHASGAGGNLYVNGSSNAVVQLTSGSVLTAGSAQDGGGLACSGTALLYFDQDVVVANNTATADGGGVHLVSGCSLDSRAVGSAGGGILNNHAGGNGGGVMVESGAVLSTHVLAGTGLAEISGNSADNNGGGVAVVGSGSRADLNFVRLAGNHADSVGGALLVDGLALVRLARPSSAAACLDATRCSIVSDNSAAVGGAFFVDGGSLGIEGTYVERNLATISQPVVSVRAGGALLLANSVVAVNDGAVPFFVGDANSSLTLGNVTVVGNLNPGAGILGVGAGMAGAGRVRVLSSLFDQAGELFAPGVPAALLPQVDCVLSRFQELMSFLPLQTVVRENAVADPRIAPASDGYLLLPDSVAIDYCDTAVWSGTPIDINWDRRDLDDPAHPNQVRLRDLGADEHTHDIHSDDFELGSTVLWSARLDPNA